MEIEKQQAAAIELSLVQGLGRLALARIWERCPHLADAFEPESGVLEGLSIGPQEAESVRSRRYRHASEEILDWARRERCRLVLRGEEAYPALLAEIPDPPILLYARGSPECLNLPGIAIVGTRRPTPYGLQMAHGLAQDLAEQGLVIVSGLARGIDAAAHRGCLESGGRTIAVLGNGIDIVYPREHQQLTRRIIETGLLVSEFPPGTSPSPQNFPIRNRLISGLALGTLIVEAREYSGSLITARLSTEQNREVFAVPGNLTSPHSFGPNYLLKQGAKLVQTWRDIAEELPPELRRTILSRADRVAPRSGELELLSEEETRILASLETDKAILFDQVYARSRVEIPRLSAMLLSLETRGYIRQVPGDLYVRLARPGMEGAWNSRKA